MKLYDLCTKIAEAEEVLKGLNKQLQEKDSRCEAVKYVRDNPICYSLTTCDDHREEKGYTIDWRAEVKIINGQRYIVIPDTSMPDALRYALQAYETLIVKDTVKRVLLCVKNPEDVNYGKIYVQIQMVEDGY